MGAGVGRTSIKEMMSVSSGVTGSRMDDNSDLPMAEVSAFEFVSVFCHCHLVRYATVRGSR